jgi:predicted small lipoprotein YifL
MIFGGFARAAAVLCFALALAGCGRRGSLEPAPDANAPQAQPAADADPLTAQLPRRKKVKKITPPVRATPADWLL